MIGDDARLRAYSDALRLVVRSGSVVLDVGTGTGVFALLACGLGARRVYALEPNDVIDIARDMARVNGMADKIVFVRNKSTEVTLPERADVMISDLRGLLPFFDGNIPAVVDARTRLVAEDGRILAKHDVLWASIVEVPDLYEQHVTPWREGGGALDMSPMRRVTANALYAVRVTPAQLLVAPQRWTEIDYRIVTSPNAAGTLTWKIDRSAVGHGLVVWFDSTVFGRITFSNAPGTRATTYGNTFFPWLEPVGLAPGDEVRVDLRADAVADGYIWTWKTAIYGNAGAHQSIKCKFRQSTFHAQVVCCERLSLRDPCCRVALDQDGEVELSILQGLAKGETVGLVAERLKHDFPLLFPDAPTAIARVGDSAVRYGRYGRPTP